jgi:hypothetical protein
VAGGFLDVSEWYAGVERGGDECVPQRVGSDSFHDPGFAGDATDDPCRGVAFEAAVGVVAQEGSFGPFPDGEIDGAGGARCERDDDDLAAFAEDPPCERFDVGTFRFEQGEVMVGAVGGLLAEIGRRNLQ